MTNDGRELRRDANFSLAAGIDRKCQEREAGEPRFSGPTNQPSWAQLARQGKKVMQFLQQRRYVAVVVDRKVQFYGDVVLDQKSGS